MQQAQAMQRERLHRCYSKWQETFQVDRLYQEVHDEVQEMHDYLLLRRTERLQQLAEEQRLQAAAEARAQMAREQIAQEQARRLERLISWLTVCIGVPALFMGFLGINLYGITTSQDGLSFWRALCIVLSGSVLLGGTVLGLLLWYIRRRDHDPEAP
jgi:hypothetical protein